MEISLSIKNLEFRKKLIKALYIYIYISLFYKRNVYKHIQAQIVLKKNRISEPQFILFYTNFIA